MERDMNIQSRVTAQCRYHKKVSETVSRLSSFNEEFY